MAVSPGKQRAVLAALLLAGGRVVPVDELSRALWGAAPPASARVSVQNYVRRLRQALGEPVRGRIGTQPGGYAIGVAAGELDVTRFEVLVRTAAEAGRTGSWETAAGRARAALALWRGEPLADTGSEVLAGREVPRLAELRLQAVETRLEAEVGLGRHREAIAELQSLAGGQPLRERGHALLMLALYRDARPSEALAAYQRARRILVSELGAEPGAVLEELRRRIAAADPALALTRPGDPAARGLAGGLLAAGQALADGLTLAQSDDPAPRRQAGGLASAGRPALAVPRELPAAVPHFTGRAAELAKLTGLLASATAAGPGAVVISAIGGTAGVGKTALAVRWAHQVADQFPDGQLYVNLHGYDPDQPVTAAAALAGFLRALGVPGPQLPAGADERAARYRSMLAGRRMLVILDNAAEVEQVRSLLPASPGCVVIVTSRDSLAGLVARDGAARLDLDLLPLDDAVGLLAALVGSRVDADPVAAAALAEQCARLPIALRVAAELAAARPAAALADLAGELAGLQPRLDQLDAGGDRRTAVRAVFSWSGRHLDPASARAFRLLGLHPGPDLDCYAAAALTGSTLDQTDRLLGALARAHLIQPTAPGRYGMHDLLREYAAEQAAQHEAEAGCRAALGRLLDYSLYTAAAAMDALYPPEHGRPVIVRPATPIPPVAAQGTARAWLEAERPGLVMIAAYAASRGWPGHVTRLSAIWWRYLDSSGYFAEAMTVHSHARAAAAASGDQLGEAAAINKLGIIAWRQGRLEEAAAHQQQALARYRAVGDQFGEARALADLGTVQDRLGQYELAAGHHQQSLALAREIGDRPSEARGLTKLGIVEWRLGRFSAAADLIQQGQAVFRETGDRTGEAGSLNNLGVLDERQGAYERATGRYEQALALFRDVGDRGGEAVALENLGEVAERLGRFRHAADLLQQALALYRETGNRTGEAGVLAGLGVVEKRLARFPQAADLLREALAVLRATGGRAGEPDVLNELGETLLADGRPGPARAQHSAALRLAAEIGEQYEQARARDGLACAWHADGDLDQARRHWQDALVGYTELGVPRADAVRAHLTALDARSPTKITKR